jgi:carotenoid cleavage dioxygenase-like enzyme
MSPLYFFQNLDEMENIALEVEGEIPAWLRGEYVRNGPGIIEGPNGSIESWFDGLAKLHAFTIDPNQVSYTSKFLKSEAYNTFQRTGAFDFVGFAQKPKEDNFSIIDFILGNKNEEVTNANVNVANINGRLIALTEIPLPVEFDPALNTLGPFDYADDLPKNYSFESAHILQDPNTKDNWNFLINIGLLDTEYQIYKIPYQSCGRQLVGSIPVSAVSYMHSFSLAGRYAVLVDYPLRARDPTELAYGFMQAFSWYGNEATNIYLVDRESGQCRRFLTSPFFSFHHVNGFEKDGKVYVDLIAYPTWEIIYKVNDYPFVKDPQNYLLRLEMDLASNTVKMHRLSNEHFEFPRLNEAVIGKDYQYFYAVNFNPRGDGIIKYAHKGSKNTYWFQEEFFANEPIFVPHPQAQAEDDGVILTIVNDMKNQTAFLLILDAHNMKELARIKAPQFIPFGFHGQFFKREAS